MEIGVSRILPFEYLSVLYVGVADSKSVFRSILKKDATEF